MPVTSCMHEASVHLLQSIYIYMLKFSILKNAYYMQFLDIENMHASFFSPPTSLRWNGAYVFQRHVDWLACRQSLYSCICWTVRPVWQRMIHETPLNIFCWKMHLNIYMPGKIIVCAITSYCKMMFVHGGQLSHYIGM